METTRFAHMGLNCIDPEKIEKFYEKHFGFTRKHIFTEASGDQIIMLGSGNVYLELFSTFDVSTRKKTERTGPCG